MSLLSSCFFNLGNVNSHQAPGLALGAFFTGFIQKITAHNPKTKEARYDSDTASDGYESRSSPRDLGPRATSKASVGIVLQQFAKRLWFPRWLLRCSRHEQRTHSDEEGQRPGDLESPIYHRLAQALRKRQDQVLVTRRAASYWEVAQCSRRSWSQGQWAGSKRITAARRGRLEAEWHQAPGRDLKEP